MKVAHLHGVGRPENVIRLFINLNTSCLLIFPVLGRVIMNQYGRISQRFGRLLSEAGGGENGDWGGLSTR